MQLHIFVFDEELKSLRGLGTPINLMPFYNTGVSITHACFVHGSEEILFIDSNAQARIFSLITLQPKYLGSLLSVLLSHVDPLSQACFFTTTADSTRDILCPRRILCPYCPRCRWGAYDNSLSLVNICGYQWNFSHTSRLPRRSRCGPSHVDRQSEQYPPRRP